MHVMIWLSLLLNIFVLVPVCTGLIQNASWATASFGAATPARGILLSIYLSIMILSGLLLVVSNLAATAALLLVQVIYKITTPITVGTLKNPVVISNLGIALFHCITLLLIRGGIGH